MLSMPFRILATIAVALFFSSKWVRRAVAAVVVSAVIAAAQNPALFAAITAPEDGQAPLLQVLAALAGG